MNHLFDQLLPEEKLLLRLCRLEFTAGQKAEVASLVKEVTNWKEFTRLSNEHGIIALCWYNLNEMGLLPNLPQEEAEIMKKSYLASVARNARIYALLDEVAAIAAEERIDIVLLKGLALEMTVYANKGLRQMNDLDILVKEEDAIKLRKALLKKGFDSMPMISPLHEKILPSYGKHLPEMYKDGLSVEIHFKLFDQKGNSLTVEFISSSVPCAPCPVPSPAYRLPITAYRSPITDHLFTPDPLHHFLYLIKHLAKHEETGVSQLRLYMDLALLLPGIAEQLTTNETANIVALSGSEKKLREKLLILKEAGLVAGLRFDEKADEDIIDLLKFIDIIRHPKDNRLEGKTDSLLKPLREMEGTWNKILFMTGYLFPSVAFMKYRYRTKSKLKAIPYYPVRWVKMIPLLISRSF